MTVQTITDQDVERFRNAIARRFGLHFDDTKLQFLCETLQSRLDSTSDSVGSYLGKLERSDSWLSESVALARVFTVSETYFFRHYDQFRALAEVALPNRAAARSASAHLSLLSAGCASGEEPYSLAMLAMERGLDKTHRISVRGIDLNPAVLEKARQGRYSTWALRETPPASRQRWFRAEKNEFLLDASVRELVHFEQRNLIHDDPDLWQPGVHDVVFCRNVLMYFTPEHARAVVAKIARSLAPGGYLFLGHAETLRGLSHDFHLRHSHDAFYYERKAGPLGAEVGDATPHWFIPTRSAGAEPVVNGNGAPPELASSDNWVDAILRASARIDALTAPPPAAERGSPSAQRTPRSPERKPDLSPTLELLERERFAEALESLADVPAHASRNTDTLLLRAALLTHGGQLALAEQACQELLAVDDLNAGAHYLIALCREAAGDLDVARHHDQVAIHLDPSFAMPRLHAGLLASRSGDRETARRELGRALTLIESEEPARLLLFGGGFQRDALTTLCRTELVRAGGEP